MRFGLPKVRGTMLLAVLAACGGRVVGETDGGNPVGAGGATGTTGTTTGAGGGFTGGTTTGAGGGFTGGTTTGAGGGFTGGTTTGAGGGFTGGTTGSGGLTGGTTTGGGGPPGGTGGVGGTGMGGAGGSIPPPIPPADGGDGCAAVLSEVVRQSWIAFDSDRDNFHRNLYMMHPDGTGLVQLTSGTALDKEPSLAQEALRLSFSSDRSSPGVSQIFVMDLATTRTVRQLTTGMVSSDQSSFSRDGKMIAFHRGASIFVINVDGTGERLVATGLDDFNAYYWPHFSADGSELVFDRNNEINAVHLDGTGFRRIVQNTTAIMKSPEVSRSGSEVAYSVRCDGGGPSVWTTPFAVNSMFCQGRRVSPSDGFEANRPTWGSNTVIAYERVNRATGLAAIVAISRNVNSLSCLLTPLTVDSRNPSWAEVTN